MLRVSITTMEREEKKEMYKIVRIYFKKPGTRLTIARGLTLEEAQAHCSDPETSSMSCTRTVNIRRTQRIGGWFDSYREEREV